MPTPVLVVHGVANRDPVAFSRLVEILAADLGLDVKLVPVFWGDLGAPVEGLQATLPGVSGELVRGGETGGEFENAGIGLMADAEASRVRQSPEARAEIAADGFTDEVQSSPEQTRRDGRAELRAVVEAAWLETNWLRLVADDALVFELGRAIADCSGLGDDHEGDTEALVRGAAVDELEGLVRRVVRGLDRGMGAIVASVGRELNTYVRHGLAPHLGAFVGDILVYQRHRTEIHERVREVLSQTAPGWGVEDRPIAVLGHSLGGVIAFDVAVGGAPRLWISHLITFGSQSPLFHVLDPRGGGLSAFRPGSPVTVGDTIGTWVNLWEPLDPLAFIAAKVFRLASGDLPIDRAIRHMASYGLSTHGSYWRAPELIQAIREEVPFR